VVTSPSEIEFIEIRVTQLFALVSEALAGATEALLSNDAETGLAVVDGDQSVDDLTAEVELLVWRQLENEDTPTSTLRHLVGVLLILPELERSGDLAEHIAQRAVTHLGAQMSPLSRGIVQRMAVRAREGNTNWAVFALTNTGNEQLERLIVVPHYRMVGSGLLWPDLGLSRIVSITSSGDRPDRTGRLVDRGERWIKKRGRVEIIPTDDGYIFWDSEVRSTNRIQSSQSQKVIHRQQSVRARLPAE